MEIYIVYLKLVFRIYFTVSLMSFVVNLVYNYRLIFVFKNNDLDSQVWFAERIAMGEKFLGKIRVLLCLFMESIALGLLFPVVMIQNVVRYGAKGVFNNGGSAWVSRAYGVVDNQLFKYLLFSIILLFVSVLYFKIDELGSDRYIYFCVASILSQILPLASSLIYSESIPKRLRVQTGHPYIKFLMYSLGVAFLLFLSFVVLNNHFFEIPVGKYLFEKSLKDLSVNNSFKTISSSFTAINIFMFVCVLIFSSAIVKFLLDLKEFRLTLDDSVRLSTDLLIIGKYNDALKCINNVTSETRNTLLVRGMIFLALNKFEDGLNSISKALSLENIRNFDEYCMALSLSSKYLLPKRVNHKLINLWLDKNPSPALLLESIPMLFSLLSKKDKEIIMSDSRVIGVPILRAAVEVYNGIYDSDTKDLLETLITNSEVETMARSVFLLMINIRSVSDNKARKNIVDNWLDTELTAIANNIEHIKDESLFCCWIYFNMVHIACKKLGLKREEEIIFLTNILTAKLDKLYGNYPYGRFLSELEKDVMKLK